MHSAVYATKGGASQRRKSQELSGRLNHSLIDVFNAPFRYNVHVLYIDFMLWFKTCINKKQTKLVFNQYPVFDIINIWPKNSNLSLGERDNVQTEHSIGNYIKKVRNNKKSLCTHSPFIAILTRNISFAKP